VYLNGKRLYTAGIGPDGVLSAHVAWSGYPPNGLGEFRMHVGGLDSATREHLRWLTPDLGEIGVGDEVLIRLVDVAAPDPPAERTPADEREEPAGDDSAEP
jgi:hypothetical protein